MVVKGADAQLTDLIASVTSLNLGSGLTSSLVSKLQDALDLFNMGNTRGACWKLKDFIATVNANTSITA